jgi:hypothetical protein
VAYHIGVREKVSPKNLGIRIRDPAMSEVPTRSRLSVFESSGYRGFW